MILYKNAFRNFIYIGDVINILTEIIKKKIIILLLTLQTRI